ncbi:MAG: DoxX family protein [Chthoniobacterales bacterium]
MNSNPVYSFFSSPPSFAGILLRVGLAVALVYGTYFDPTPLFAQNSELASVEVTSSFQFARDIFCYTISFFLLIGFFTRLAAFLLFVAIVSLAFLDAQLIPSSEATHIVTASAAIALAFLGAGIFSADRKISQLFLPNVS